MHRRYREAELAQLRALRDLVTNGHSTKDAVAGDRRGVQNRGDRREFEAKAVVQHERDSFLWREPVENHLESNADRVSEHNIVGRVRRTLGHVKFGRGNRRPCPEPIQAQPGGHRGEPRWQTPDLRVRPVQQKPGLLHDVLRLRVVGQHTAGKAQ